MVAPTAWWLATALSSSASSPGRRRLAVVGLSLIGWSVACTGGAATKVGEVPTTSIPTPAAPAPDALGRPWTKALPEQDTWLDLELAGDAVWIAGVQGHRPEHGSTPRGRKVCALDSVDGAQRWCTRFDVEERTHDESPGRLFVDSVGGVFVGAGAVVALDPGGGVVWTRMGLREPNLIGIDDSGLYVATRRDEGSSVQRLQRHDGRDDATWKVPFEIDDAYQRVAAGSFFARTSEDGALVIHALDLNAGTPPKHHEVIRHDASVPGADVLHALLHDLHGEAIDTGEIRQMDWVPWLRVELEQWSYSQVTADRIGITRATRHPFEAARSRGEVMFRAFMRGGLPFVLQLPDERHASAWMLRRLSFDGEGWELPLRAKDWWAVRLAVDELGFTAVLAEGEDQVLTVVDPNGTAVARRVINEPIGELELQRGAIATMSTVESAPPRRVGYERFR